MQTSPSGDTAGGDDSSSHNPGPTMSAAKKQRLADAIPHNEEIVERYEAADAVSHEQTAHGLPHAINVGDELVPTITGFVQAEYPGLVSEDDAALARIAGLLHDNGRADEINKHGLKGARWANRFLQSFTLEGDTAVLPHDDRKRVVKAIACHSFGDFMRVKKQDVVLDILYVADKCAGDETRVRPERAAEIERLSRFSLRLPLGRFLRLTWISDKTRPGGEHDRVNYAIKRSAPIKDGRNIVLRMEIDLRICDPSLIWSVRWNRTAYQGCWIACKRLGFEFQLEINGVRYRSNGGEADWERA